MSHAHDPIFPTSRRALCLTSMCIVTLTVLACNMAVSEGVKLIPFTGKE